MNKRIFEECVHYAVKENAQSKFSVWLRQCFWHKFEMPYIEFFITTKCNLRCEKCSNLIPLLTKQKDLSVEEFKSSLDLLMSKIDRLYRLKLHGGEVFLHPQLADILEYANNENRIVSIRITTNGTIIPSEKVLKTLSDSKIVVQISDYDIEQSKVKQLMELFRNHGIKYAYLKDQTWKDMGDFEKRDNNRFQDCTIKRCTSLLDNKVYVCSRAAIMAKQKLVADSGISLDLETKQFRKEIKKLYCKSALECNYCDGDTCYAKNVKAGEQIKWK